MSKKEEIWTVRNGVLMLKSRIRQEKAKETMRKKKADESKKKEEKEKPQDKLDKKGGK